ncbi:hypothetical protein ACQ4LE_010129 [Meloidogyne hapla]|uniref:Uncharacterized protein n=1 Tax=Meloidogyne hapla TaxID=6305 RepID=A0A1I8AZ16_MELHA
MNTLINNNYPKISAQQQQNIQCKVRFQNNNCNNIINDFASQNLPKMDIIPSSGWKRFSSLKLKSRKNKKQNQQRPLAAMSAIAHRQQQSVRRLLTTTEEEDEDEDDDDDDEEEEETSSNSVPLNNTNCNSGDGRRRQGETSKEFFLI